MTFSLKKLVGKPSSTADVVDGHLILSLPNAAEPVVWRMALDKIGTAAFEIKQDNNSETTKLILKPKKGTAEIIAPFKNKEDALGALMAASNALQTGQPQVATPNQPNGAQQKQKKETAPTPQQPANSNTETQKWMIAVLGAIIVLGLYYYLTTLIPTTTVGFDNQTTASSTASPQQSTGVPVSADDFLSGL